MTTPPTAGAGGRVVVVGAINLDLVVAANRLPGPGETVVGAGPQQHGGGKGANASVAAARAGATVRLVGAVGADEIGASALNELRQAGVDVSGVAVLKDEATGVALIVVDPQGENQIAVGAGANAALGADWVRRTLNELLGETDCALVSTEIPGDAVIAAVEAVTAAGVPCVLNTAPPIPAVLEVLDRGPLLTPNGTELEALVGMLERRGGGDPVDGADGPPTARAAPGGRSAMDVQVRARSLAARTGAPIIVTLGGEGALLVSPGGRAEKVPPLSVAVRDTTGAGDTFNGVLATRLALGDDLGYAVRVASAAAALSVSHSGARGGMPDAATIEAALRGD